jgi:hypothetical protein
MIVVAILSVHCEKASGRTHCTVARDELLCFLANEVARFREEFRHSSLAPGRSSFPALAVPPRGRLLHGVIVGFVSVYPQARFTSKGHVGNWCWRGPAFRWFWEETASADGAAAVVARCVVVDVDIDR